MSDLAPIEPTKALDEFFAVVRQEAVRNPAFQARLLEALKVNVVWQGEGVAEVIDHIALVKQGHDKFRKTFLSFDDKTLKKLLADHGLASKTDIGKQKGPALVELMWDRAQTKRQEVYGS